MSEFVYSMYRADKFYGPDRQVLANISLSFFHGAKIGVLGPNGAGQVDAAADHGRARGDLERRGAARARARPSGCSSRSRELDPAKDVRGNVEDGVRELRDLLDRFDAISAAFAEPGRRLRRAARRAGEGAGRDRRRDAWALDATLELAMDALRLPAGDRDVDHALGRRAPPRRALPPLLLGARPAAARRADQPSRRRDRRLARALPRPNTRAPSIAVTHDRYFLDNVAGWILELDRGHGIPWEGNYSSWLEQKQARLAVEEKQESARRRTLARELEWVRMSPRARHAKSKARLGAYEKLLAEEERVKLDRVEIHIPPGPAARRPRGRGRGAREGLRRPPPVREPDLLAAARRASSASSGPTAPARRRSSA